MEFLKYGKWGIHYGGRREGGSYQIQGNRLIMKSEEGSVYQDAKMTWRADSKVLELNSGEYLMRLKLFRAKGTTRQFAKQVRDELTDRFRGPR